MKIAIRGEGSTDIGELAYEGSLQKGPLLILLEKLACFQTYLSVCGFTENLEQKDFIEWLYIHKDKIKKCSKVRRIQVTRGKKGNRDAKGFYKNSEAFAHLAREENADIAIFFVDADKDSPFDRNKQVKAGLEKYGYIDTGVPMIPTKISEAWLLCCLDDYKNCEKHEQATTDKTSPDYPKNRCEASGYTRHEIAENCDPNQIDMPLFFSKFSQKSVFDSSDIGFWRIYFC
jgi:hypothetical protein